MKHKARQFNLSGLRGISDATLETHFKLYSGYVENTNSLLQKISELTPKGKVKANDKLAYAELKRRVGFEYNGMVLHELYFDNLKKNGGGEPQTGSAFLRQVKKQWGSYAAWRNEFIGVGQMRGVGWAICYQDPATETLLNQWVTLHEDGHLAGYTPILVMDVWEHAFLLDYKPAERDKYIDAFFSNVNWSMVESRLSK